MQSLCGISLCHGHTFHFVYGHLCLMACHTMDIHTDRDPGAYVFSAKCFSVGLSFEGFLLLFLSDAPAGFVFRGRGHVILYPS